MQRLETHYPLQAREFEIQSILRCVTRNMSAQLISVPGAGRSTVLRLLAYNKAVRQHYLQEREPNYLFVYANFAEIGSFTPVDMYKFLLVNLMFATNDRRELSDELHKVFHEVLLVNDQIVFFQHFKHAMDIVSRHNITTVFLLDRFSEFTAHINDIFFLGLHALKLAASGRLAMVFSMHAAIQELLPYETWQSIHDLIIGNEIYMQLSDRVATDHRIALLEKQFDKKLPTETIDELYRLTGGHAKLMRLSTQLILQESVRPDVIASNAKQSLLETALLKSMLITAALLEIWEALSPAEQHALTHNTSNAYLEQLGLPFPLLTSFVQQNMPHQKHKTEIRVDTSTNEIFHGDAALQGLTAQEYRLLAFLINNANRVCSREEIISAVWNDSKTQQGVTDEALDQMIHRLRRKVEDEADNPRHIVTIKGRGFRFIP